MRSWVIAEARRLVLSAALIVALCSSPAAAATPRAELAHTAADFASRHDFSGTVLVVRRGRTLYSRSFGLADRAFSVPARADTRYWIASITKLFTAVLILQLAQEGRLTLDEPLRTALPEFPGQGADRITIHHLLNHTSGIAPWDRVDSYQRAFVDGIEQYQRPLTTDALLRRCCSGSLDRSPGTAFAYNNADYLVLGRIVERLTGLRFEEALAARILRPVGLASTGMLRWDRIVPRLARTYFWRDDTRTLVADMPVYAENWDAAGAMYSTAGDLARFADALYGGRLIRGDLLDLMLAPGLDDYGYGLWSYRFTHQGRSWRVAKRPGSIMGANGVLYRLLDSDTTIVLLANSNRADLDRFAQRLADTLVSQERIDTRQRQTRSEVLEKHRWVGELLARG
jgi:D-alanyl-D-alanine carboxypeptidase